MTAPGSDPLADESAPGRTFVARGRWRAVAVDGALTIAIVVGLLAFGSSGRRDGPSTTDGSRTPRIALFIAGTLGDKSFNDSAARGIVAARKRWNLRARVVEGGYDPTRWEASFTDLVDSGDFDVVVAGTFTMVPMVQKLSGRYPSMRFILYDAAVDHATCRCSNVYSVLFRQSEGAYLAGWLATRLAGDSRHVGVIGAMQIPVIDDFIVGFTAGAKAADGKVDVTRQYVNSFKDPAAAKEIAKAVFAEGATVLFQAAGASGQGIIEAAAEAHRYVIGVDSDQYAVYALSDPLAARYIATSVIKDVDVALERAIGADLGHRLAYGSADSIGLAEGGISLARSSDAMRHASPALLAELDTIQRRIVARDIVVPSVFGAVAR